MPRHVLALLVFAVPALAQNASAPSLTLAEAIARAQASAPDVVAARMRIAEARSGLIGASLPFSSNPSLELEAGRRSGETTTTDSSVSLTQDLDLPRVRRSRLDIASAQVAEEESRASDVERQAALDVATTFLRALEARERSEAATAAKRIAEEALHIAERRFAAGDVAQLDVNLARAAVARADSEARVAKAFEAGLASALQVMLALDQVPALEGSLRDPITIAATTSSDVPSRRSDVRRLDAEIATVEAEKRLADTSRWPGLALRATYSREEGDRIVLGGVGVTLPVFQRGQQETALAAARLARLRAERAALIRAITAQVQSASATANALRETASGYERSVMPLVEENERLALESYDAGQIGLADLLVVRRDAADARRALLDHLIQTRLAEIELRALAGAIR